MTTKENLEKAAYTAVGAPVAGMKAMKEKAGQLADTIKETRSELKRDALREFDEWVAEGEMVVDRMIEWLRSTGASSEIRNARETAVDQVRSGVSTLTDKMEQAIDVVEPDIALTEIRGIGPANAKKLNAAGVPGIASFIQKTATDEKIGLLADETGIAVDTIAEWRVRADLTQLNGIGDSYQRMLHAAGIGTLTHLANADAATLAAELDEMEQPGLAKQAPSESEVSKWVTEAGRLSLTR